MSYNINAKNVLQNLPMGKKINVPRENHAALNIPISLIKKAPVA